VSNPLARLWPRSLAGRLTLLLVVTLAIAQLGLTLVLNRERDSLVEELMHSQALNQTVTLTRLLDATTDEAETLRLLAAFGSRTTCAEVVDTLGTTPMSDEEARLSELLRSMLHGAVSGMPQINVEEASRGRGEPCGQNEFRFGTEPPPRGDREEYRDRDPDGDGDRDEMAALTISVPLDNGRWLSMRSTIALPSEPNRLTWLSFFVSALAVAVVTVLVVRSQTRLLRNLAQASERFGRGEQVDPLPETGPSEVTAATTAFNTMQARLSQFIAERMRLLAGISHDLRTPLTTLRLKAELLDDDAARDDLITTIDELSGIAEAALAFTRAEAANEETQVLDLAEPLDEIISEFQLAGADVAADGIEHLDVPCRPVSLKRAIRNLVENAVRYGGSARVSLRRDGTEAVIEVTDSGPGIPEDRIADAFKPFVRLEPSRNAETGGIGLGLSIAMGIVHAHGGTIVLTNRPEGGLAATIWLPLPL
jgi:signal transduction histidine kinase